jgi:SAM-dependent methyltransferase
MSMPKDPRTAEWFRRTFDELYPSLYSHRDVGEARDLLDRLGALLPLASGRVLDLGCGPGRYLRALSERGAQAVGVDLSRPLLLDARRSLPGFPLVRADMRLLPFRPGSFRTALMMFTTFGYFATDEEDLLVLRGVSSLLEPGGRFLLDYVNAHFLRDHLVASSSRRVEQSAIEERRWIDADGRFLHKESRVAPLAGGEEKVYRERLRLYEPVQIEGMLRATGFEIETRLGDYRARPFDEAASPRLLVVARSEGEVG